MIHIRGDYIIVIWEKADVGRRMLQCIVGKKNCRQRLTTNSPQCIVFDKQ